MPTETWGENITVNSDDYNGVSEDTSMFATLPTTNFETNIDNAIGTQGSGILRALIRFDIKTQLDVLGATEVNSAILNFDSNGENNTTDETLSFYRVLRAWVVGEATYNNFSTSGGAWGTAGCDNTTTDRSASAEGSILFDTPTGNKTIDITTAAENWRSGTWAQDGLVIINDDEVSTDTRKNFASADDADGDRPSLSITYTLLTTPISLFAYYHNQARS